MINYKNNQLIEIKDNKVTFWGHCSKHSLSVISRFSPSDIDVDMEKYFDEYIRFNECLKDFIEEYMLDYSDNTFDLTMFVFERYNEELFNIVVNLQNSLLSELISMIYSLKFDVASEYKNDDIIKFIKDNAGIDTDIDFK